MFEDVQKCAYGTALFIWIILLYCNVDTVYRDVSHMCTVPEKSILLYRYCVYFSIDTMVTAELILWVLQYSYYMYCSYILQHWYCVYYIQYWYCSYCIIDIVGSTLIILYYSYYSALQYGYCNYCRIDTVDTALLIMYYSYYSTDTVDITVLIL